MPASLRVTTLEFEFAVDVHRNLLKDYGLLCDDQELRPDRLFRGRKVASGLVMDDFYTVSVQDVYDSHVSSASRAHLLTASQAYDDHETLGSKEKDVIGPDKAKVTGAELGTSAAVKELNMATLASPTMKRLALNFVSLELAKMRCWSMMSLLDFSFGFVLNDEVREDGPKLILLSRAVAQELVPLAVLCPFMAADLMARISPTIFASDSSDKKGAIVATDANEEVARALWRSGKKKGGYIRLLNQTQALLKKLDPDFEEPERWRLQCQDMAGTRTKMRRLEEWQRLLELGKAGETWTASCMFGSTHNKELMSLFCLLAAQSLHRKCDLSHMHVKVQGQFTKITAVYTDDLAEALAAVFSRAIAKKLRKETLSEPEVRGWESPLCNDVLVSARWRPVSLWTWRGPHHINVLEGCVVLSFRKKLVLVSPGVRQVFALDPSVGLPALAKRSFTVLWTSSFHQEGRGLRCR